uniref:Glucagon like peptide 2 receptor n=1 Tax=Gouania willdenowi TaxID=441366 RepID=A0A8C5EWS5_GOUWI
MLYFCSLLDYLLPRKLHCTRNYIHMNLFVSFMLRAIAVISKEIILYIMYSNLPKDDPGWNSYSSSAVRPSFSKVCMEYFVACNYFWLLVEAIFLHTLLFTAHILFGTPVLFVAPWTVVKILYENTECWSIVNRGFWWIIRGPISLSVLVIFYIFIKILMLLLSKLKADQVKFTDYRYSLARATLVLIPLLGIHEVVFTVLIDESVEGSSRYAKNFVNLTLSSFQGFLVAVLYCFANGEVCLHFSRIIGENARSYNKNSKNMYMPPSIGLHVLRCAKLLQKKEINQAAISSFHSFFFYSQ